MNRIKAVNKRLLFSIGRNSDSPARMKDSLKKYVSTTQKSCFRRQEYLKQPVKNGFQQQERLLHKKWLHLNLNNGFHQHKTRRISRKSISFLQNQAFVKKFVSTSRKNCFRCWEQKKLNKIGLHLITRIVFTSRKKLQIKA